MFIGELGAVCLTKVFEKNKKKERERVCVCVKKSMRAEGTREGREKAIA